LAEDTLTRLLGIFRSPGRAIPEDPLRSKSYREGQSYGKFAYRQESSVGFYPRAQEIDAVGDTLLLDELVGSESLYVKLGSWGNPWTRLEEGDELTGRFAKLWITTGAASDAALGSVGRSKVEATFLTSWGRFKRKGQKTYGMRRGFKSFRGSATTVESSLFAPLVALVPSVALVFGKRGGSVVVRNRDLANTLLVRHGVPGVLGSDDYWEIYPGEAESFPLASRIHSSDDTIIVATAAGTCDYGFLTSAFDIDRADLDQTIMPGI
jgi:hypothetical protein